MPGQSGPKVAYLAYPTLFNTPYFRINVYFWLVYQNYSSPPPQGDRGFDGLAGLPGEKGNRVSHFVAKSVHVRTCLFWSVLLVNLNFFVVVGWIWTFWTPWCYRRGWREGNLEHFWLYAESYDSMLNDTSNPFTSNRTFHLISSFMLVCFDSCTPLPASNLPQFFWLPAVDAIWSPWALYLWPYYLHTHTCICTVTHECPMLHILAFLPLSFIICFSLWPILFFSQGDDGEIGPRGLPGEPVSDHMY